MVFISLVVTETMATYNQKNIIRVGFSTNTASLNLGESFGFCLFVFFEEKEKIKIDNLKEMES